MGTWCYEWSHTLIDLHTHTNLHHHAHTPQEAAAHRLWHHLDAASTQRALVQRGLSSLPSTGATIDVRPWRGPRLRAGVDGGRVGPNYERDYLPAIGGGKEMKAPLPSSDVKFWLPEDRCVCMNGCACISFCGGGKCVGVWGCRQFGRISPFHTY